MSLRFAVQTARPASTGCRRRCAPSPATLCSWASTLFGIEHYGALYRLKITRAGQLILTSGRISNASVQTEAGRWTTWTSA
ncbi:hemin uptake protein HemP [Mesorhizobium temperatum]|uniref:hemin uptake protein HemP n=1 Tax=Mesorhizobium temperatum TaxID=241416 RepID=UPI003CC9CAFF